MPRAPKRSSHRLVDPEARDILVVELFDEPDHQPELDARTAYEKARDGHHPSIKESYPTPEERATRDNPFVGVPDPGLRREDKVSDPYATERSADTGQPCRPGCTVPSHQQWFLDRHPAYLPSGECVIR